MVGKTMKLIPLFDPIYMFLESYTQLPSSSSHVLKITRTRQKISDMCSATGYKFFDFIRSAIHQGTKVGSFPFAEFGCPTHYTPATAVKSNTV